MKLNNQVAIVTGGALGIGGGVARKLAREGSKVLIVDIAEEEAKRYKAVDYADKSPVEKLCQGHGFGEELQKYLFGNFF